MMHFRSATTIRLLGASAAALAIGLCMSPAMAADQQPAATPASAAPADSEIIVTGSRLTTAGFSAPTPVTVVGAAEITRQGATTVSEVLNQVPSFRAQNTPATTAIFASNIGASTADLRGLGANRTLVLIDGRRVVAATTQGGSLTPANVVDLNMIPTSLIERSDVVTGGASAQYGSDAVAGVVNIIINTKLNGFRGSVQYGQSDYGDGKEYAGSLAWGTNLGDRGHLVVGGDYSDNKGTGDCYSRAWCAAGQNQVTNSSRTNGIPAVNILPNTATATASRNGLITNGVLAGNEFTPDGQSLVRHNYGTYYGVGLFQSGGGDGVNAFYEAFPIVAPVRRYATFGHADYELSDSISAFAELSYADVHGKTIGSQTRDFAPPGITIQRDNAFLPTSIVQAMTAANQTSFLMGRIGDDLKNAFSEVHRNTFRGVFGLKGKITDTWSWDGYYQYGRTNYHQKQFNTRINDNFTRAVDAVKNASGNIVCRVNADASTTNDDPNCSPLNLFGENHFSPQAKAYAFGTAQQDTKITQHVLAATVHGDLFDLWAGPLAIAAGGEYREDMAHGTADPISMALRFYTSPGAPIDGKIKVKEGFVEAGLPLARDMAFAKSLDLNGAVRVTDYSTSGTITSWKVGGTWEPVNSLRFRITQSRDIRAPNIFELYGPKQTSFQSVLDPAKGGANTLPQTILGGNPNLVPETAQTFTVGAVVQPDFWGLNGLRFSVDYYDIKLKNAIATLGSQVIVNLCFQGNATLCNQVVRDSTGTLVSVSNTNLNLNRLNTRGIDFELDYNTRLTGLGIPGNLAFRGLMTHVMRLTTIDPTGTAIDRSGMIGSPVSSPSGLPSWEGNFATTYTNGPFSGTVQVRYVGPGVRDVTLVGPDDPRYQTLLTATTCPAPLAAACSVNINHAPAYAYVNINGQYKVIDDGNKKVELFFAIKNLFNTDPPNYLPSSFGPTNNVLYDVLGRAYRVGVRVEF